MKQPIIKLAFKQIIDSSAKSDFEKNIFNDTYAELLLQANVYNRERKFTTVAEMSVANPKANSLHYKVGFAIGLYVNELRKIIPGLTDSIGNPVLFDIFKTEIVHSDLTNKSSHKIALTYITSSLILVDSFSHYLILAKAEEDIDNSVDGVATFTIALQPNLSIVNYLPAHESAQEV